MRKKKNSFTVTQKTSTRVSKANHLRKNFKMLVNKNLKETSIKIVIRIVCFLMRKVSIRKI